MTTGHIAFGSLCLLILAGLFACEARSDPAPCGPHEKIISILEKRYGETLHSMGVSADGRLVEVYASPSGSWSLLVTMPNGTACMMASGDSFQTIPEKEIGA